LAPPAGPQQEGRDNERPATAPVAVNTESDGKSAASATMLKTVCKLKQNLDGLREYKTTN
jgi:hypothetical protein